MEPATTALVAFLSVRGTAFLDAIIRPSATDLGETIRDRLRMLAGKNMAKTVDSADRMLADAGQQPHPVPGRILFPILDAASVEEDGFLQLKWAALLANAATFGPSNRILPAYCEILRQLVPVQARILDWMYDKYRVQDTSFPAWQDVARSWVEDEFSLSVEDYELLMSDLSRLQLVDGKDPDADNSLNIDMRFNIVGMTTLAVAFIAACRPPQRRP